LAATAGARFPGIPQLLLALEGAAGKRRSGFVLAGLVAVAALLALGMARFWGEASPQATAALPVSATLPVSTASAPALPAPEPAPAPQAPPFPSASAAASATRAPVNVPSGKRRPPKPTDVRYKDWLKDPF
jgi:PPE-repeat protein